MKQSAFIKQTSIPASLVRAVVRQLGGWEEFQEQAQDVANHGAAGGFSGFTYYGETREFARKNKAAILEMAADLARDIGDGDEYQLIAGFNCLKSYELTPGQVAKAIHTGKGEAALSIMNALAWFALEEVARAYDNAREAA